MSHYFTTPDGPEKRREIGATIWEREYTFTTANGVFSGARLDPSTAILLREVPPPADGARLLDLGCGYGPIAVALADHCPASLVDAVDVNQRALGLAAENARRIGAGQRVRALLPEQADPATRYDEIWSNPPIRIGKPALHELLLTWLPRLAPTGRAVMVVGKNLGADSLARWLEDQGYDCTRLASHKGFRVLEVRPDGAAQPVAQQPMQ
ncbi:class I SAM-dependent methyltransferase [Luteococcus sp.]|uniref:class I SAM-dependent methyltransferase n=1 Tax=Luteococcus sp. TaxID=1969402 RepID=UPI0037362680